MAEFYDAVNRLRADVELLHDTCTEMAGRALKAEAELRELRSGHRLLVEFDLSVAEKEGVVRQGMIDLGWMPPEVTDAIVKTTVEIVQWFDGTRVCIDDLRNTINDWQSSRKVVGDASRTD